MKIKYIPCISAAIFLSLTGCNKNEKAAMQSQVREMQSNNVVLQRSLTDLSTSNAILREELTQLSSSNLVLQQKVKSGDDLNALLRQQLDSATAQINKGLETAKANVELEKLKPIEEVIRALRRFDSAATVSITFDEYRKKLQDLKVALDENSQRIEDAEIKQSLFGAYADYEDAYIVWAASLGDESGDWRTALKKHGHWSKIPDYVNKETYEQIAKNASSPEVTGETMYNYIYLKYAVGSCLKSCSASAKSHIAAVEKKLKSAPQP